MIWFGNVRWEFEQLSMWFNTNQPMGWLWEVCSLAQPAANAEFMTNSVHSPIHSKLAGTGWFDQGYTAVWSRFPFQTRSAWRVTVPLFSLLLRLFILMAHLLSGWQERLLSPSLGQLETGQVQTGACRHPQRSIKPKQTVVDKGRLHNPYNMEEIPCICMGMS